MAVPALQAAFHKGNGQQVASSSVLEGTPHSTPLSCCHQSHIPAGKGSKVSHQGEVTTGELPSLTSGSEDAQSEGDAPGCGDHSGCWGSSREGLVGEG